VKPIFAVQEVDGGVVGRVKYSLLSADTKALYNVGYPKKLG
jgi:hypothetical protein